MSERTGATLAEWSYWRALAGRDLLPCVMNKNAEAAPGSKVSPATFSKTPTRYNGQKKVTGIAKWTGHEATEKQLDAWSKNPDYGICLITREFRAIDVDIEDQGAAEAVLAMIYEDLGPLPIRTRNNSAKFCALVHCPGELSKTIVRTAHGAVEFLATGQQTVVAGTHSSGARLKWDMITEGVPTISIEQWNTFIQRVLDDVGLVSIKTKEAIQVASRGSLDEADDDALEFVLNSEYYEGTQGGMVLLRCPFESNHTTPKKDATETVYFPRGIGGVPYSGFRCMHAHCQGVSANGFLTAIGFAAVDMTDITKDPAYELLPMTAPGGVLHDGAMMVSAQSDQSPTVSTDDTGRAAHANGARPTSSNGQTEATHNGQTTGSVTEKIALAPELPPFHRDRSANPLNSTYNIRLGVQAFEFTEIPLRFDRFTERVEAMTHNPNGSGPRVWRDLQPWHVERVEIKLEGIGMKAPGDARVERVMRNVAVYNEQDVAIDWTRAKRWDGVERIERFLPDYFGTADQRYERAIGLYLWVAIAARILSPGAEVHMMPVAIGRQGIGKTRGFSAMVPDMSWATEVDLSRRDDELSIALEGKLIGIVNELRGLRTREAQAIKSFLSRPSDNYRRKYARDSQSRARRFVFVGDTNDGDFLSDSTGNRRFLPFNVLRPVDVERIARDRDQLIAEAAHVFADEGIEAVHYLADGLATEAREDSFEVDEWHEAIEAYVNAPVDGSEGDGFVMPDLDHEAAPGGPEITRGGVGVTTIEIAQAVLGRSLGDGRPADRRRIIDVLRRLGFEQRRQIIDGRKLRKWFSKSAP